MTITKVCIDQLRRSMAHAVTVWDRKQSTKRGYNVYALGQYFTAIEEVCKDLEHNPNQLTREAIARQFNDRLRDHILRSLGFTVVA